MLNVFCRCYSDNNLFYSNPHMYVFIYCMYVMYVCMYRVYQNDWSSLEVDYIHKYGEQNYKY